MAEFNRRWFLGGSAAFAAQCVIDPEFALWVPGQRSFFIPDAIVSPDEYYGPRRISNAEALAAQREIIRADMPQLMMLSSRSWNRMGDEVTAASIRPSRIPRIPIIGGGFARA